MESIIDTVPAGTLEKGDHLLCGDISWVNEDTDGNIVVWIEDDNVDPLVFDPDQLIDIFGMVYSESV